MKTTTITLLLLLSCCQWLAAQCTQANFEFTTQGQIDSFQLMNPGCIEISGRVEVSGMDVTNLLGLSGIKSVGSLNIHDNPILLTLNGLDNVVVVEGTWAPTGCGVSIRNNPSLLNLKGLDSLSNVGGPFTIFNNTALESLEGLELLESVGFCTVPHSTVYGGLSIENNSVLTSVNALENFSEGDIYIQGNPSLESLEGLIKFGHGSLFISENGALDNLAGLENLDSLFGSLSIGYNENLTSFIGLENLQYIQGGFIVNSNPLLTNFNELANIKFIGNNCFTGGDPIFCFGLHIENNAALESLYGLDSLLTIGGSLSINSNGSLQSLCGLNKDVSINGELEITGNNSLSSCHVKAICNYLSNSSIIWPIWGNSNGCNDQVQVENACPTPIVDCTISAVSFTPVDNGQLIVFPNPATDFLNLHFPKPFHEPLQVSLFDSQGRLVSQQSIKDGQAIELRHLPNGVYSLKVTNGKQVFTGKFIKQ